MALYKWIQWLYFHGLGGSATMEYSRIQSLLKKVNKLKIEELQDFKLSISVGMAFAPSNGTTFMELYRHADHALYQTKRTGKNDYKIYKNDEN